MIKYFYFFIVFMFSLNMHICTAFNVEVVVKTVRSIVD